MHLTLAQNATKILWLGRAIFFLRTQCDQRKRLWLLRKKAFLAKDCSEELDKATKKTDTLLYRFLYVILQSRRNECFLVVIQNLHPFSERLGSSLVDHRSTIQYLLVIRGGQDSCQSLHCE